MPRAGAGDRLACGESTDELLSQVADGRAARRSAHQAGCPHCQATLVEYDRLWSPVREATVEPIDAPESVLETALHRIRAVASNPTYGVLTGSDGRTRIADRVVVVTAREAAQNVPGVRLALGRLTHDREPQREQTQVGVAGASTAITLTVAVGYGEDLPDLGERIRTAVTRQIRAVTGLDPVSVSVVIDDVFATTNPDAV